jgi:response regulator of citrate/malate metabolism
MIESGDAKLLAFLKQPILDEVPEGFYTTTEWEKTFNLSNSQTRKYLTKAVNAGKMEMRRFHVQRPDRSYPVPHYRVV